jgi:hypothetical protein
MIRLALVRLLVFFALPWVTFWAWRHEREILRRGRPLAQDELQRAALAGVAAPGRIRVLTVDKVPMPGWRWVQRLAARLGFDGSTTAGMALRYGIYLRRDREVETALMVHECAHTAQYERLGSIAAFMRRYLVECLRDGYAGSALEAEARDAAKDGPAAGQE